MSDLINKKSLLLLLTLIIVVGALTGCGSENDKITFTEKTQLDGKKVGVLTGSSHAAALIETMPYVIPEYFYSFTDMYMALENEKVSAVVVGDLMAEEIYSVKNFTYIDDPVATEDYAFLFNKNNQKLCDEISEVIVRLKKEGVTDELFAKWSSDDESVKVLPEMELPAINGTLEAGHDPTSTPFAYYKNNESVGYEVELLMLICQELGYAIHFSSLDFPGLIPGVQAGKYDFAFGSITITDERKESALFSEPIYSGEMLLVVNDYERNSDVDFDIAKYGVLTGSVGETYVAETYPNAKRSIFDNLSDCVVALQSGKVDYVVTSITNAKNFVRYNNDLEIYGGSLNDEDTAIAVGKNNTKLLDDINRVITQFKEDGTLDMIISNWIVEADEEYLITDVPVNADGEVLKVGISANREPMCFIKNNKITGVDAELIERIAYELGMRVEYTDVTFGALIPLLESGKVDCLISNLTKTAEREEKVNFTQRYFTNPQVILKRKNTSKMNQLSDFNGKTIASLTGTVFDQTINRKIENAVNVYYNDLTSMVEALRSKKISGIALDEPVAKLAVNRYPELYIVDEFLGIDYYSFAFRKDSELSGKVTEIVQKFKEDGTLNRISKKWLSYDDSAKVLPVLDYKDDFDGSAGTIRLGHDLVTEPMSYVGDGGASLGMDIEVAMRIAYELNMNIELIASNFDTLIPALISDKVDMICGCITITEERMKTVDFCEYYYQGGMVLVALDETSANSAITGFFASIAESFRRNFIVESRWKLIVQGLGTTILIAVAAVIFGTLTGFVICGMRISKFKILSYIAQIYVRLMQGTPIVVILMLLYYVVFNNSSISGIAVSIIGFSFNFAAYVSEMMRSGIDAVDNGQLEAAQAIGFNKIQTFRFIVFPQAARYVLPVFKGEVISTIKATSIVGYIAVQDLTKMSDIIRSRTFEAFFPIITTALIYIMISYILTSLLAMIEIKINPKQRKRIVKGVEVE